MDVVYTERGQLLSEGGYLPRVADPREELLMYFNIALIDALDNEMLGPDFTHNLLADGAISQHEINLRNKINEIIVASPLGSYFVPKGFYLSITDVSSDGSYKINIGYDIPSEEVGEGYKKSFTIRGGKLELEAPDLVYPILDIDAEIVLEELLIEDPTSTIVVAAEADQPIIVLKSGTRLGVGSIVIDITDIPIEERRKGEVETGLDANDAIIEIGVRETTLEDVDGETLESGIERVFLKDIINDVDLGTNSIITAEDLKGNINNLSYMDKYDDFAVEVNVGDTQVEIGYTFAEPITRGNESIVIRGEYLDESQITFPASDHRAPKVVSLDNVLEPGVYTIAYLAGVKREYDASMWRE